jgi:hypothetical protein
LWRAEAHRYKLTHPFHLLGNITKQKTHLDLKIGSPVFGGHKACRYLF